jgi:branched-chain amino acid transport system substrate-binding protein
MKQSGKFILIVTGIFLFMFLAYVTPSPTMAAPTKDKAAKVDKLDPEDAWQAKPKASFDASKMSDMSDFDPANPDIPTGDTIRIGVATCFSGAAALNGEMVWVVLNWVAHDINKQGGIFVDGKKKKIQLIKGDTMSKPDQAKKICEKLVLQDKVHILWGTNGSNIMKVINEVANKYKVIAVNMAALSDDLMDATNFGRYSFMSSVTTQMCGEGLAYYYGQIRKKEKKFYILCQDYSFGRGMADGFKKGLKRYYPEAEIVGEDYHKLFLTDFAPYLTKIKASGAEVIFTNDWHPDAGNLLKQSRQIGIKLPFANVFMNEPNSLNEVGVEGTEGLVNIDQTNVPPPIFNSPGRIKMYRAWNGLWRTKWKAPYNTPLFEHGGTTMQSWMMQTYWMLSVVERTKSTDAEKIIATWEGDTYRTLAGKVMKMRPCDHVAIQDLLVTEYVKPEKQKVSFNITPYYWYKGASYIGPGWRIPAGKILPMMDQKLDRCKGKSDWGE